MEASNPPEYIPLGDLIEQHRGRWIAVEIGERDECGQPISGKLLAESIDKHHLRDLVRGVNNICLFYASDVPQTNFELMF